MPWVDVDEPFSAPPRMTGPLSAPGDAPVIDVEDRWGSVIDAELRGPLDASACERLELRSSVLQGVSLVAAADLELDVAGCTFVDCDLSAIRLSTVTTSRFEGCKLSGLDFGSGIVRDVAFDRTILRMSALRMTSLERVEFRDSTLDDVDLYETQLVDVAFPGSVLRAVDVDKVRFTRVDLRGAVELDLRSARRLEGVLLSREQVLPLAELLAHAAGVGIERPTEP